MLRLETQEKTVRLENGLAYTTLRKDPLAFEVCDRLFVLSPNRGTGRLHEMDQNALTCLRLSGNFVFATGEAFAPEITPDVGRNIFWLWMAKLAARPEIEKSIGLHHYLHTTGDFSRQELIKEVIFHLHQRHELLLKTSRTPPLIEEGTLYELHFLLHDFVRFTLDPQIRKKIESLHAKYGPREKTPWHYLYGVTLPQEE